MNRRQCDFMVDDELRDGWIVSLDLVLDGWLFTGPLDKAFPSVFLVFVFGIWDFGMLVFFCHSESLKVPLYFLVFSTPRSSFWELKLSYRCLQHSPSSFVVFGAQRFQGSLSPLHTALFARMVILGYVFGCVLLSLVVFFWFRFSSSFLSPSILSLRLSPLILGVFLVSLEWERGRKRVGRMTWKGGRRSKDALVDRWGFTSSSSCDWPTGSVTQF